MVKNVAPEKSVWYGMRARVLSPKNKDYARYGGRGIKICDRWFSFDNFLSDMGARPVGSSIDRIDNNGDYEPSNCRWATRKEQMRNTSRSIIVEIGGIARTRLDWLSLIGVTRRAFTERMRWGWDEKEALTTPSLGVGGKRKKGQISRI